MIAILHNIRSAHNVGSIFRTADGAGIEKIYLGGYTPSPIDRFDQPVQKISKVSLGAEKNVDWEHNSQTTQLLKKLKRDGYKIIAIEQATNSTPLSKIHLTKKQRQKTTLLFGNELRGLSPSLLKQADQIVEIPMLGPKESLNVSVAFGIAVYWLQVLT